MGASTAPPGPEPLVLVLPGGVRHAVTDTMTIGRGDDATVKIDDQTVSRLHCRIAAGPDGPVIEDAGSRFGVTVSGRPLSEPTALRAGQEIRLGNVLMRVESAAPRPPMGAGLLSGPGAAGPGGVAGVPGVVPGAVPGAVPGVPEPPANATIVVPVGATGMGLRAVVPPTRDGALRPRLRSGWALKQVEPDGAVKRYVLRDLRAGAFLKLDEFDAQLLELFDGKRTVAELLGEATQRIGPTGPGRLARLVADLGERGMLDGVAPTPTAEVEPGLLARAFKRREKTFDWVPEYFQRAYKHWGHLYFNGLAASLLVLLSIAGIAVFSYLVGSRYGTPLVVAHRLLIGGLVFIAGRFFLVSLHELAHGLALAHYGRTTNRAGIRMIFIFPYAFVDSSEGYFESRMHRIVISAAGPLSDFSLAALFSILCLVAPKGNVRDVFFQLAFAGYIGAFFNINPFLDRDGYQILTEWTREPNLKQRARAQLKARLSGRVGADASSPVLARYAVAGLIWSVIGAGFMAVMSLRYYSKLSAIAPHTVVLIGFILFFVMLLLPVPIALGAPLVRRARYGTPEVNRAVR